MAAVVPISVRPGTRAIELRPPVAREQYMPQRLINQKIAVAVVYVAAMFMASSSEVSGDVPGLLSVASAIGTP